jgi:hypothetical protein
MTHQGGVGDVLMFGDALPESSSAGSRSARWCWPLAALPINRRLPN